MNLSEYLEEVEHAVGTVIAEIHAERKHFEGLQRSLAALNAATRDGYRRAESLALDPDLDDEGLGTAVFWDTYFGPDKDRFYREAEVEATKARLAVREFSIAALSGNLLQYAKQGLSLKYGKKRAGCPVGREVSGLPLHEIIWQARNQALHWEEGEFHPPVVACFDHLARHADAVFSQYATRNMAYDVVRYLGWESAEDFFRDMRLYI